MKSRINAAFIQRIQRIRRIHCIRRGFSLLFALLFIVPAFAGCASPDDILLWEFRSGVPNAAYSAAALTETRAAAPAADDREFALRFGYSKLGQAERGLYAKIRQAVFALEPSVPAAGYDYAMFKSVFTTFCADYPECFWVTGDWSAKGYERGGARCYTEYSPRYRYSKTEVEELQTELDKIIGEFLNSVGEGAGDYEKMLAVYDYVASYANYDDVTARKVVRDSIDNKTDRSCSIDGFFLDRLAVCSGFSKATQLLLRRLGIECAYVTGKAAGGRHSWNLVRLDGEYYHVDTTWAATRNAGRGAVSYNFFCVTSDEITYDHTVDIKSDLPDCDATALNYYVYNGLCAESSDEEGLVKLIKKALEDEDGESVSIKFADEAVYKQAYKLLFGDGKIFDLLGKAAGVYPASLSYSSDDGRLVITLYPEFKNAA